MKNKLSLLVAAAFFVSSSFGTALAANNYAKQKQLKQLNAQMQSLQKELTSVKAQLKTMQNEKAPAKAKARKISPQANASIPPSYAEQIQKMLIATRYAHGPAVVASPFLGTRNIFDTADLIVNLPSINTDLRLLEQRQILENHALKHGEILPQRPLIDLSGSLEAEWLHNSQFPTGAPTSKMDIDLTRAELDVVAEVCPWVTGDLLLSYENTPPLTTTSPAPGARLNNSRFKVDRAFITVGNLNKAPVYFTVGQIYVPFGNYSSIMVTDPVTKLLGRTKARAAQLGFSKWGLYGSVFAYHGDSYVGNSMTVNSGGANLAYKKGPFLGITPNIGVSYILNLADTKWIQDNIFGFAPIVPNEQLVHRVPGISAYLTLNSHRFGLMSEYVTATRSFDPTDVSFNNSGARPHALDLEGVYHFRIFSKKTNFGVGYNRTWQALALGLPKQSYFAVLSTSLWNFTIESLEFRHNMNYNYGDVASFGTGTYNRPVVVPTNLTRAQNVVTLKIGAYF